VILAVLLQAAEHAAEETSKTPFYVAATLLVIYAVILSAVGTMRHETFPPTRGLATGIMLLGAVLVAGVMATAVITG
jgi:hypothetical protein